MTRKGDTGHDPLMEACWDALDAWDGIEPSPTFRARVWERLRQEPGQQSWLEMVREWFVSPRTAGVLATLACLVVVVSALVAYSPAPVAPPVAEVPLETSEVVAYAPQWESSEVDMFPDLSEIEVEDSEELLLPVAELGYVGDVWVDAAQEILVESL